MTTTPAVPARKDPLPDNAPHVLVVDDDHRIRDLLVRFLSDHGFRVSPAADSTAARNALRAFAFDLIVLDVMMPGDSGLVLAKELKAVSDVPICMMTALVDPEDRVRGLETGVDDYVAKPFEPMELLIRLRNIMRRGKAAPTPTDEIRMGDMSFHIGRGELRRGAETIKLTEREKELLRQFAQRPGMPIARHELAPDDSTGSERAIDVQINRLRRKLEADPSNPVYLQTLRGKGYILYFD